MYTNIPTITTINALTIAPTTLPNPKFYIYKTINLIRHTNLSINANSVETEIHMLYFAFLFREISVVFVEN